MNKKQLIDSIILKDIPEEHGKFKRKKDLRSLKKVTLQIIYNKIQDNMNSIESYHGKELCNLQMKDLHFFDKYTKEYITKWVIDVERKTLIQSIVYALSTIKKCIKDKSGWLHRYSPYNLRAKIMLWQVENIKINLDDLKPNTLDSISKIYKHVMYYVSDNEKVFIDLSLIMSWIDKCVIRCLIENAYKIKALDKRSRI
tara:strand:- start:1072 stop:1668 length:597 start_codon:yes stop_codon:yes gene_type:complete